MGLQVVRRPSEVIPGIAWELGTPSIRGFVPRLFIVRSAAAISAADVSSKFGSSTLILSCDEPLDEVKLGTSGAKSVRLCDLVQFGETGLYPVLGELRDKIGSDADLDDAELEPWKFEEPGSIYVRGKKYQCNVLTVKQKSLLRVCSGKTVVPLDQIYQSGDEGVWNQVLADSEHTASATKYKSQRHRLNELKRSLEGRLLDRNIPLGFRLARGESHLIVNLPEEQT
jgi:hypothetical protein